MPFRAFVVLLGVCLVWAFNVIVSKWAVADYALPPMFYAGLRTAVVALALLPWLLPVPKRFLAVGLIAIAMSGGPFALFFIGLKTASPAEAAIISLTGAPITVLLAVLVLGERIGWRRGAGILVTLCGVGLAFASPIVWKGNIGIAFIVASQLAGALGAVFLKTIDVQPLRLQAWAGVLSTLLLIPLSFATEGGQMQALTANFWPSVGCIVFSALVVSVAAHTTYMWLVQRHDVNLVATLALMTPMFTMIMGVFFTGDRLTAMMVLGAALALAGVLVLMLRPSRKLSTAELAEPRN